MLCYEAENGDCIEKIPAPDDGAGIASCELGL